MSSMRIISSKIQLFFYSFCILFLKLSQLNTILFAFGLFFALLGIAGSILPIIPGPLTAWVGILLLYSIEGIPMDNLFLSITFFIALIVFVLDQFISIWGVKKFGGDKKSIVGSLIGLVLGLLVLGPFGLLIGPFLGAFIGGFWSNRNVKKSIKSSVGALIGFFTGTFIKLLLGILYFLFFIRLTWQNKSLIFS